MASDVAAALSGEPRRWRLITFDIDGTLTRVHGWRFIAERVGRVPEYEASNRRFFSGVDGEDAHLADLLHLADGLTVPQLQEMVAQTPKIGGIGEMVTTWHEEGTRIALLTHNPWYVCEWYVRAFGFDGYSGTKVPPANGGTLWLTGPVHADKVGGLNELVRKFDVRPKEVVHVGDGTADALVFPHVGAGVALNTEVASVQKAATLALQLTDLRGLPTVVDAIPRS